MSKVSMCEIEEVGGYLGQYECTTHGVQYCDRDKNPSEFCPVGEVESDFEEVKELLAEQEKKTKILLDALESIVNTQNAESVYNVCDSFAIECAEEALEEYKKG